MTEYAAGAIGAKSISVKDDTRSGFEALLEVLLLHKLVITVGERACLLIVTAAHDFPISAHLSLDLSLVVLHEGITFLVAVELSLWSLNSGGLGQQ
jgi:hypothetical protein